MGQSLEEVKNRLRQSFLGKGGIHGVGVNRAERAIRIYMSPQAAGQPDVLDQVREAAKPFPVFVVTEDRPQIG